MKAFIGVALLWFGLPVASIACSCVVPPGSEKTQVTREFNEANAVFLGYVHSEIVRTVADNPNYSDEEKEMRAKIGVEQPAFGSLSALAVLITTPLRIEKNIFCSSATRLSSRSGSALRA